MKIGVLALHGGVEEHLKMMQDVFDLRECDGEVFEVRTKEELAGCTGLIVPGGESTVMMQFIEKYDLSSELERLCREGTVYGTCAGLILLSKLGYLNVEVERNAYGRQTSSFISELNVLNPFTGDREEMPVGHFIRAPKIVSFGSGVEVLAEHDDVPVLVRQGNVWASSFHPELSKCIDLHKMIFCQQ